LQDAHQEKGGSKTYFSLFLRLLCNLAQIKKLEDAPWSKMELGAPSREHTATREKEAQTKLSSLPPPKNFGSHNFSLSRPLTVG